MIPDDLKVFSLICEYRAWVLFPLFFGWLAGAGYFLCRRKRIFFLWLAIFPLVIQGLGTAAVYCGWHYRMELRDRFARRPGDPPTYININLMPPAIRAEYAKHNYHPRFRDIKAGIVGIIVMTPILYAVGGLLFVIAEIWHNSKKKSDPGPEATTPNETEAI